MLKTIKLPYKCIFPLIKNPTLLKAFCIWGKLKLKHSNSSIHNIKKRKKELAEYLNISENTLRKYLGILKTNNLIKFEKDGTLRFSNKYVIYNVLGVEANTCTLGFIKQKTFDLKLEELEVDNIKLIALQLKKDQINYRNTKRIQNILIKDTGTIYDPKIKQKTLKSVKIRSERLLSKLKKHTASSFNSIGKFGFVDDNMCGESIAKMFGRKSKSSGLNFLHKMKRCNRMTLEQRYLRLNDLNHICDISKYREIFKNIQIRNIDDVDCIVMNLPYKWNINLLQGFPPDPPSNLVV